MLKVFEKAEFGEVKVMRDEVGSLLFVGKDVAKALGYPESSLTNIPRLFRSVPDEWKGRKPIPTLGGEQEMLVVSEAGLYFFLARSDKPKALPFQKWLAGDVVPSIRRTGSYSSPQTEDEILSQALIIAEGRLGMLNHAVSELHLDAPKVELAEAIMETEECVSINQFAKIPKQRGLDIGANVSTATCAANRLYRDLRKDGYLIRRKGANWNMPKQRMMDKGYFRVVERMTEAEDDYQFVTVTTMITGAGQYHLLAHFLDKYGVRRQLSLFGGRRHGRGCVAMSA